MAIMNGRQNVSTPLAEVSEVATSTKALTPAQETALRLLAERPEGHYAGVRNHFELGVVGHATAQALERLGLARVSPDRTGYWVEITEAGKAATR